MTEREKLIRDIKTLNESIRLSWVEIDRKQFGDATELSFIRANIELCIKELSELLRRLPASN